VVRTINPKYKQCLRSKYKAVSSDIYQYGRALSSPVYSPKYI